MEEKMAEETIKEEVTAEAAEPVSEEIPEVEIIDTAEVVHPLKERNKEKKTPVWEWILFGVVLAIILAVAILFMVRKNKNTAYSEAVALENKGDYEGALSIYTGLGTFDDSEDCALRCRNNMAYNDATLKLGKGTKDNDSSAVAEAKQIFAELGDFKDSADKVKTCDDELYYIDNKEAADQARALFEKGDDDSAREAISLFESLPGLPDSEEMIEKCKNLLKFNEAKRLSDSGDFDGALAVLGNMDGTGIEGYDDLGNLIESKKAYAFGEFACTAGYWYTAYKSFVSAGDYEDAKEKAEACKLELPPSGEQYHNENYYSSMTSLKYDNRGFTDTCLILYSGDEMVSRFFVRANEQATIYLPEGRYRLCQAYGDSWFGFFELFGDEGDYYECSIGGEKEFTLASTMAFTITASREGWGVETAPLEMKDMTE